MSVGGKPTFEKYADKVNLLTNTLSKLIPCAAELVLDGQGKSPLGNFGSATQVGPLDKLAATTEKGILLALLSNGKYLIGEVRPQQVGPLYDRMGNLHMSASSNSVRRAAQQGGERVVVVPTNRQPQPTEPEASLQRTLPC